MQCILCKCTVELSILCFVVGFQDTLFLLQLTHSLMINTEIQNVLVTLQIFQSFIYIFIYFSFLLCTNQYAAYIFAFLKHSVQSVLASSERESRSSFN